MALTKASTPGLAHADPEDRTNPHTLLLFKDGELVAAMSGHVSLEGSLCVSQIGDAKEKWGWIQTIVEAGLREATRLGFKDVRFATPLGLKRYFKRLLTLRGMHQDDRVHGIVNLSERYCDVG